MKTLREAADAYVAAKGFEHSGGVVERAFEAGAKWAAKGLSSPYGYVFGGCTFLHKGSPLVTDYVEANSLAVFLQPSDNVMETYIEVMTNKIGDEGSAPPRSKTRGSVDERAEALARQIWGYFKGDSTGGTTAMQWFDNNKSLASPAHVIKLCRAALASEGSAE